MKARSYNDPELGEFEFRHAWIGKCSVVWNGEAIPLKIRMISSEGEPLTHFQRETAISFVHDANNVLARCKKELKEYCQKIYAKDFESVSIETVVTPLVVLFERQNEYGLLFRCKFEDEINLAVKFSGGRVEVGTDDILL